MLHGQHITIVYGVTLDSKCTGIEIKEQPWPGNLQSSVVGSVVVTWATTPYMESK